MTSPRVMTKPLGGNPLAIAAMAGTAPTGWYEPQPRDVESWRERIDAVRSHFPTKWLESLYPAIEPTGAAKDRLNAVADGKGVVVTTGQQPGLFGGPIYTLSKALSALAFADVLQQATGVPVAPVFWAATDDTDFREASSTAISLIGGAQQLRIDHQEPLGQPMAAMPLGDVSAQLDALARSAGSAIDRWPIELLEQSYRPEETIGSAYVAFLRALLSPLGISVIDASSAATRAAAKPVLVRALERATEIAKAVRARSTEMESAGFGPQVQEVPGLSLVFSGASGGRKRVPIKAAETQKIADDLGPNVLLRPVVERAILPTATYIGGPAEIAYFGQLGVIADAIGAARPAIVPRWSCTIIEPHVEEILEKLYLLPEDLQDPHEAEARVARSRLPKDVLDELNAMRTVVESRMDALADAVVDTHAPIGQNVTGGLRANLMRRLDRFERRLIAGAKRQYANTMTEIGTARGSLYPLGKPQERALNFVPLLARYGSALRDEMLVAAAAHARNLIDGSSAPHAAVQNSEPIRVSG
ncbi:MAG: bacillithiol biosynthesis protein BshC [Gemmatimonadaceae bacterium]